MYYALRVSYALTLILGVLASAFLVRIFVIAHDCAHGSLFPSNAANNFAGCICSLLTFTPYHHRRQNHAIHHAYSGNLSRRTTLDFPVTLTVREYLALPERKKWFYRFYRHPLVQFGGVALVAILYSQRFALPTDGRRERFSIRSTNLALLGIIALIGYWIGFRALFLIQTPVAIMGSTAGMWLVYMQHQFENAYWQSEGSWNFYDAGLKGSSFYKLPPVLQWFTANIGLHHIHHLNPRIPNYALQRCHRENPSLHPQTTLTLRSSLRSVWLCLWDDEARKLVSFAEVRKRENQRVMVPLRSVLLRK
jgi:omega-6 fatty acid desaturase (delta-12 desaturase)